MSVVGSSCGLLPGSGDDAALDRAAEQATADGVMETGSGVEAADGVDVPTSSAALASERMEISELRTGNVRDALPVSAGQLLDIELGGWEPGSQVAVSIEPATSESAQFTANDDGVITGLYAIAPDAAPGFHQLRIIGPAGDSRRVSTAVLEIPGDLAEGQTLGQYANGFQPHELVEVQFMDDPANYVEADSDGAVFVSGLIPVGASDATFRLIGEVSGTQEASYQIGASAGGGESSVDEGSVAESSVDVDDAGELSPDSSAEPAFLPTGDAACDALGSAMQKMFVLEEAFEPEEADLTVAADWAALQNRTDELNDALFDELGYLTDAATEASEWSADLTALWQSESAFWGKVISATTASDSFEAFEGVVSAAPGAEIQQTLESGGAAAESLSEMTSARCGFEVFTNY